jgi:hypothetical protein
MAYDDAQILEFKSRLGAARERLEIAAHEVEALEQIVAALESLAAAKTRSVTASQGSGDSAAGHGEGPGETVALANGMRRKRAPRGLPGVVRELMSDGEERSLDEIEQFIAHHPRFRERAPVRSSISNRLNEFVNLGYLVRPSPTNYRLASGGKEADEKS